MGLCLHALHPVRSNPWVLSTYMYVIMLWGVLSVDVLLLEWWSLVYSVWGAGCQIVLPLSAGGSIVMRVCEFALPIISFCWFKWIWRCIVCLILGTPTLTRDCFSDWLSQPSDIKMLLFHAVNLMPDRDPRLHFHWTYCATIQHLLSRDFTDTHTSTRCVSDGTWCTAGFQLSGDIFQQLCIHTSTTRRLCLLIQTELLKTLCAYLEFPLLLSVKPTVIHTDMFVNSIGPVNAINMVSSAGECASISSLLLIISLKLHV